MRSRQVRSIALSLALGFLVGFGMGMSAGASDPEEARIQADIRDVLIDVRERLESEDE